MYIYITDYSNGVYQLGCKAAHRQNLTECFDKLDAESESMYTRHQRPDGSSFYVRSDGGMPIDVPVQDTNLSPTEDFQLSIHRIGGQEFPDRLEYRNQYGTVAYHA